MRVWLWALVGLYGLAVGAHAVPTGQHAFHVDASMEVDVPQLRSWSMRTLERTCALFTPVSQGQRIRRPEALKWWLRWQKISFVDVTDTTELGQSRAFQASDAPSLPTELRYESILPNMFALVREDAPRAYLSKFTSFFTRYYRSDTGAQSQRWLQSQVEALAASLRTYTRVHAFQHPWKQRSILLYIKGANATLTRERGVTILGAHLDSINFFPFFAAPGADDDGSGTVTILEALRALGEAGWVPESDVELHWYSAEEGGLLGSRAVAAHYEREHRHVQAMLQMDMTAFVKQGTQERIGVVVDFVSPALTAFVERLIQTYVRLPVVRSTMHYGASDHASWSQAGYPSAFVIEAYVCPTLPSSPFEDCNLRRIHVRMDELT